MRQLLNALIHQDGIFMWIAVATGAILLIPLLAMQITDEVAWTPADFFVMGSLLFGSSSLFVLIARKLKSSYQGYLGLVFAALFLYAWAELAVGVFTNLGS